MVDSARMTAAVVALPADLRDAMAFEAPVDVRATLEPAAGKQPAALGLADIAEEDKSGG